MSPPELQSASTRSALVLYGTETGNAQDVAYEISQSLERLHFVTASRELDATPLPDLIHHDLVVFAISTTGQGDFPLNARKFWQSLLRKKLTASSLVRVKYGIIGLCDSSYPKFNLAARKLHKRLQQLGASPLLDLCEADEQGEEGTEGAFLAWLPLFQEQVLARFPLQDGQLPIPSEQKLPSRWTLAKVSHLSSLNGELSQNGSQPAPARISNVYPEPCFLVVLERNDRVTPNDHWQDVRFLKLRAVRPIDYMPGDALAIRPRNAVEDVEQLIRLSEWQDAADTSIGLRNAFPLSDADQIYDSALAGKKTFTLRELLTEYLDINAIPRRSFFAKIAHFTDDEMQKERALEFTDPQYLDEYFDYATRPRRSILEVLQEFHTVKIPWQEAINIFPIMRPRQFSVASGGSLKEGGQVFELLVAIVKYRTVIKRIREGVCTRYLAKLPVGTTLNVVLHTEGRFHSQTSAFERPHLLIGGGTGIAPLRSIIYEKLRLGTHGAQSTLIFGCRNAEADYFFGSEWSEVEQRKDSALRVITAFSRDQESKVYIQDRIRQNTDLVKQILADLDSMVIVCGSSGAMPKAVREALKDVLAIGSNETDAEQAIAYLEKTARYKQETW
ncbi:NAPDH-dependent diflavin reductase [Knufia obscura]|uniref:NADPH-dependent diflavin oxidoreductase 1 n=2 Tax=Knufia TaxID=430999 RepID=A0AAN8EVI8_9EURO|nr:NAPDH-dependent diflavin reductase [Knufia obscura]KAK5954691.1 NAPDH-dependent diflavin reductase [Knufia fluminis]